MFYTFEQFILSRIRQHLFNWMTVSTRARHSKFGPPRRRLLLESLEPRSLLATAQLNPIADNTLFQDTTGSLSDGAGQFFFAGVTNPQGGDSIRRGLLNFDIASNVPAGSHIDSVSLSLHVSTSVSGPLNIGLNTLAASWGEGTVAATGAEGRGAPATSGSATWLHRFFNTTLWTHAGGDFTATPSANTSVGGAGSYTWTSSQMATDVQGWLDNPSTAFGWMVKAADETTAGTGKQFDSRENSKASFRPVLTIQYTVPNVNHAPTVASPIPQQYAKAGNSFSLVVPASTFADVDTNQTHTLSVTRADGTGLPAWLTFTSATSTFQGTPQDSDAGILNIKVTATDSGQPPLSVSTNFVLVVAHAAAPWQNPVNHLDIDTDGFVVPLDALRIINQLNTPTIANPTTGKLPAITAGSPTPPPFLDVNGDGFAVPIDALIVINFLNAPSGEGKGGLATTPPVPQAEMFTSADVTATDRIFAGLDFSSAGVTLAAVAEKPSASVASANAVLAVSNRGTAADQTPRRPALSTSLPLPINGDMDKLFASGNFL